MWPVITGTVTQKAQQHDEIEGSLNKLQHYWSDRAAIESQIQANLPEPKSVAQILGGTEEWHVSF